MATKRRKGGGAKKKTESKSSSEQGWDPNVVVSLALLVIGLFVYRDFVFGDKLLLYKATASDSINDSYPYFVHLSEYLRTAGFPSWSFGIGMGQSLHSHFCGGLLPLVALLPKGSIASALVFQQLFKVILAGAAFAGFLRLRGLNLPAAVVGAAMLGFSAFASIGSGWPLFMDEVVLFALLLLAAEAAISRGRWVFLPIPIAGLSWFGGFDLYLGALMLVAYVPARLIEIHGWNPRRVVRTCGQLAAVALLGVGLGAVGTINSVTAMVDSPRGAGDFSFTETLLSTPVFDLESGDHYKTALLRMFSNDMLGTGDKYSGWYNYMEAPVLYCGILCLLLLPQAFVVATRRTRWIWGVQGALLALPIALPWFRHLFWLFVGDYYRTFSLFVILWVITLSMTAFARFVATGQLNKPLLLGSCGALVGALLLSRTFTDVEILLKPWVVAMVVVVGYGATLSWSVWSGRKAPSTVAVMLICGIELIVMSHISVAEVETLTKSQMSQRAGFNDHTVEAIRYLDARDKGFYRVTKTYDSSPSFHVGLNDAMVFGYNGTSSYASFNNSNYIRFLQGMDVIGSDATEDATRWAVGLHGRPVLSSFACEKYLLTRSPAGLLASGLYERVEQFSDTTLLRNRAFVPFGVARGQYVSESEFRELPTAVKDLALFDVVVLSDDLVERIEGLRKIGAAAIAPMASRMSIASLTTQPVAETMEVQSFGQTRIEGSIEVADGRVVVFQMPFDRFWHAEVDGNNVPTLRVDFGLLGIQVPGGRHEVTLRYGSSFVTIGWVVTALSLFLAILAFRRWPVIDHQPKSV